MRCQKLDDIFIAQASWGEARRRGCALATAARASAPPHCALRLTHHAAGGVSELRPAGHLRPRQQPGVHHPAEPKAISRVDRRCERILTPLFAVQCVCWTTALLVHKLLGLQVEHAILSVHIIMRPVTRHAGYPDRQWQAGGPALSEVRPAGPRGRRRHGDSERHHHRQRQRAICTARCDLCKVEDMFMRLADWTTCTCSL